MIKTGKHYLLIILWLVFLLNQVFIRLGISAWFLRSYLDDMLALPIMLGTYLLLMQIKKPLFTIPTTWILISVIIVFIHFELLLPLLSATYTHDLVDGVMYACGGLFFALLMNKKKPVGTPVPTGLS